VVSEVASAIGVSEEPDAALAETLAAALRDRRRRLSVFAGWSLEMAERVCADDELPAAQILGLLARLTDASLIEAEQDGQGQRRYRMPASIRQYAARQLEKADETAAMCRRLRDCVLSDVEYPESIVTVEVPVSWSVVRDVYGRYDTGNVRVVLAWCLEQGDIEAGLRICAVAVWPLHWAAVGTLAEWAGWLDAFLAADQSAVPDPVRGAALASRAQVALACGDDERAESWAAEALPLCQLAGGSRFTAMGHGVLVEAALRDGRTELALSRADQALAQDWQPRDRLRQSNALSGRAFALSAAGRLAEAQEATEAALALMLEADHQYGAAVALLGLAELSRLHRDLDAARGYGQAALPALREAGAGPDVVRCLTGLGRMAVDQGDLGQAREYLTESLQLSLTSGSRAAISRAVGLRGTGGAGGQAGPGGPASGGRDDAARGSARAGPPGRLGAAVPGRRR
jgi:tetratricopeptide (TPR) repeat protein